METRDKCLLRIRPEIPSAKTFPNTRDEERFQNETLRPIAKFQNNLMLAVFRNYIQRYKNVFYELTLENRLAYIENAIYKDTKLRNSLRGIIVGQFTLNEYEQYIQNSSALNKRMMEIVIDRLQSNIQLLKHEYA